MMDLIDRNELEPDTEWSDYYDGFTSYSQSQINGAVEVKAVPLDKVKQAREEIASNLNGIGDRDAKFYIERDLQILDKLIAESEEV